MIILVSTNSDILDAVCAHYSCNGFKFKSKTVKRKYKIFGEKTYTITMVAGKGYYQTALKNAVALEDYEMAAVIKKKLENL